MRCVVRVVSEVYFKCLYLATAVCNRIDFWPTDPYIIGPTTLSSVKTDLGSKRKNVTMCQWQLPDLAAVYQGKNFAFLTTNTAWSIDLSAIVFFDIPSSG